MAGLPCAILSLDDHQTNVHVDHSDQPGAVEKRVQSYSQVIQDNLERLKDSNRG